jgi:hypothetical protein
MTLVHQARIYFTIIVIVRLDAYLLLGRHLTPSNLRGILYTMRSRRFLELFCGTKVMTREFARLGAECITLDNDIKFEPDICVSILDFHRGLLPRGWKPDFIWASPPCTGFTPAAAGKYWHRSDGYWQARNDEAGYYLAMMYKTLSVIKALRPRYWFIENPVSLLRNLPILWGFNRVTVTYCQYGETRRKPTDIWTNCDSWIPRQPCKPGDPCHEYVPHGTHRSGVMRQAKSIVRAMIPGQLCQEIARACLPQDKEL